MSDGATEAATCSERAPASGRGTPAAGRDPSRAGPDPSAAHWEPSAQPAPDRAGATAPARSEVSGRQRGLLQVLWDVDQAPLELPAVLHAVTEGVARELGLGCTALVFGHSLPLDARLSSAGIDPERAASARQVLESTDWSFEPLWSETDGVIHFRSVADDPRVAAVSPKWREHYLRFGVEELLVVPMRARQRDLGLIVLTRLRTEPPLDEVDLDLARLLGDRLAVAVDAIRLLDQLRASERSHRALVAEAADVVLLLAGDGRLRYASPSVARFVDVDHPERLGVIRSSISMRQSEDDAGFDRLLHGFYAAMHPDDVEGLQAHVRECQSGLPGAGSPPEPVHVRLRGRTGEELVFEVQAVDRRADRDVGGIVITAHEITPLARAREAQARHAAQQASAASLARLALSVAPLDELLRQGAEALRTGVGAAGAGVLELVDTDDDPGGGPVLQLREWVGAGLEELAPGADGLVARLPYDPERHPAARSLASESPLLDAGHGAGGTGPAPSLWAPIWVGGARFGVLAAVAPTGAAFSDGDLGHAETLAAVLSSALSRLDMEREIRHQATHDALTGLPNRLLLDDRLSLAFAQARRSGTQVGLLLLDLDGFKDVNDALGHAAGDRLLVATAQRLHDVVRDSDTVCRLGGDEFAICLPGIRGVEEAVHVARKLGTALRQPVDLEGGTVPILGSIGIEVAPGTLGSAAELLRRADVAMYRAKSDRLEWAVYDERVAAPVVSRLALLADLRVGIAQGEVDVHFQPVVDLRTGAVTGVEALARWSSPTRGDVSPGDFIALAEQSGVIRTLTERLLSRAVEQAASWRSLPDPPGVAVNLSGVLLRQPDLAEQISSCLRDASLPSEMLTLEIPESVLAGDEVGPALERLAETGCRIAIDDFGTGYSGLAVLKRLPVSVLKIDRSFVSALGTDDRDLSVVRSVVDLAHAFGLEVVAEGVETAQVADLVGAVGVDKAQGYWFGRPVPGDRVLLR